MLKSTKEPFVSALIDAIEFGLQSEYVTAPDLQKVLTDNKHPSETIKRITQDFNPSNPNRIWEYLGTSVIEEQTESGIKKTGVQNLSVTTWAYFQYTELLELQEARLNAIQARKFSQWSIALALLSIIVAFLVSLSTQTVRVENVVPVCTDPSHSVHLTNIKE